MHTMQSNNSCHLLTNKCQNTKYVQCNHKLHYATTQFYKHEIWETKIKRVTSRKHSCGKPLITAVHTKLMLFIMHMNKNTVTLFITHGDNWSVQVRAIGEVTPVTVKLTCARTVGLACTNVLWISYTEN